MIILKQLVVIITFCEEIKQEEGISELVYVY